MRAISVYFFADKDEEMLRAAPKKNEHLFAGNLEPTKTVRDKR